MGLSIVVAVAKMAALTPGAHFVAVPALVPLSGASLVAVFDIVFAYGGPSAAVRVAVHVAERAAL